MPDKGAVPATAAVFRVPIWLVPWLAYLVLAPFDPVIGKMAWSLPVHILGVAAAGLLAVVPRASLAPGGVRKLAAVGLLVALCASCFTSEDPEASCLAMVPICLNFACYLLASLTALDRRELALAARAYTWGGGLAAAVMLSSAVAGQVSLSGRPTLVLLGEEADPNFFAAGLVLPFALALLALARGESPRLRWEGLGLAAVMAYAEYSCQSRGGMLAFVTAALVLAAARGRPRVALAIGATLGLLYFSFAPLLGRFDLAGDPTGSERTEIWEVAAATAAERWPAGIGLNALPHYSAGASGLYASYAPHNTYIQAGVEGGLAALMLLLLAIAAHLRFRRDEPLSGAIAAGLAGVAVAGLFLHLLTFKALWLPLIFSVQAAALPAARDCERGTT